MRSALRLLLDTATLSADGLSDTVTKDVPTAAPASSTKSTTSVFIIYMAIGFSVTFAAILVLMVVYHCCRNRCPPVVVEGRPAQARRRSSSQGRQFGYELKQLFVVQHPGGSANLAFREDEELKPYKKKKRALLLSASLDDTCFTIPAHKASFCDPDTSNVVRPERQILEREDSSTLTNDGVSDILTESMLSASSDILLADDLEDVSQVEYLPSHTAGSSVK